MVDVLTLEKEALTAFFTHIASFSTLPTYWPNVAVPGSPADEHYRVTVFPVTPESVDLCGSKYLWIVQIGIYVRDGVGSIKPAEFVGLIRSALPQNLRLTTANHIFQTTDPATAIPPIKAEGWNITPVQCRFFSLD